MLIKKKKREVKREKESAWRRCEKQIYEVGGGHKT